MSDVEVQRVAERALLVRFGDERLEAAVARAQTLAAELAREPPAGLVETVLGAGNLLALFETADAPRLAQVEPWLRERARATSPRPRAAAREHRIAVCYGGADGPDLEAVASAAGLTSARVVELHSRAVYVVAFVGFSPGFAYLLGLPRELELPRRPRPRPRVAAGSVAIAGPFSGVYPQATPGGWHLVGRTELTLFDPGAAPPARLAAGDRVRFVPEEAPR